MNVRELMLIDKFLPEFEQLEYRLEMLGAKGSVKLTWQKNGQLAELKCQVLASLYMPPKKLVDSQMLSSVSLTPEGTWKLSRHMDNDFKTESRRQFDLKDRLIETKYIKFDEERGYIEYPEGVRAESIFDPILALYTLRNEEFLSSEGKYLARVLVRSGVVGLECHVTNEGSAKQLHVRQTDGGQIQSPILSEHAKVYLERSTGIVTEITYPLLGPFGKISLKLSDRR